jgi:hypothetical protein
LKRLLGSPEDFTELRQFRSWLQDAQPVLDTSETDGLHATRLTVQDSIRKGLWTIALKEPLDMVQSGVTCWEKEEQSACPLYFRVETATETPTLMVHPICESTDGVRHVKVVDTSYVLFRPLEIKLISPLLNDVVESRQEDYRGHNYIECGDRA